MEGWTAARIPQQVGRLAVVTGATDGVGYAIALALAQAGADVVIAAENEIEGRYALALIRPSAPAALVRFEKVNFASLASVHDFAARLNGVGRPIDLLINNGIVNMQNKRRVTEDGQELQWGANYLGYFALTARLLPLLRRSRQPRVVQISSLNHRRGAIDFDDLQQERAYDPWKAYCQSKLAMLIFALELQRRSDAHGWGMLSAAAHPGYSRAEPLGNGFSPRGLMRRLHGSLGLLVSHSPAAGALPALFAATAANARRGGFYGPCGPLELIGPPDQARVTKLAKDLEVARRLWVVSEQLAGVTWPTE